MAITLGAETALSLHLDHSITYTEVETALVDAGFTSYTITRNVNVYDGSSDVQLFVRGDMDANGQPQQLDAADTMQKLAEAMEDLSATAGRSQPTAPEGDDAPTK